jgi:hypothetical protein
MPIIYQCNWIVAIHIAWLLIRRLIIEDSAVNKTALRDAILLLDAQVFVAAAFVNANFTNELTMPRFFLQIVYQCAGQHKNNRNNIVSAEQQREKFQK